MVACMNRALVQKARHQGFKNMPIDSTPKSPSKGHHKAKTKSTPKLLCTTQILSSLIMSTCGNCDCADKSQCVKKGNNYGVVIVETEKRTFEEVIEVAAYGENDGKCKCSTKCTCDGCGCGK